MLANGISMEELQIRGFHVYQDYWTPIFGEGLVNMSQVYVTKVIDILIAMLSQSVKEMVYYDIFSEIFSFLILLSEIIYSSESFKASWPTISHFIIRKKISLENFTIASLSYVRENYGSFPPQTICIIQYRHTFFVSMVCSSCHHYMERVSDNMHVQLYN